MPQKKNCVPAAIWRIDIAAGFAKMTIESAVLAGRGSYVSVPYFR